MKKYTTGIAAVFVLLLIATFSLLFSPQLPDPIGEFDYRAYWSASYLLGQGENFGDDERLFAVQQEQTASEFDFVMKTWNPPWVLAWLLPYTFFPFDTAVLLWFLTNVAALFTAVFLSWRLVDVAGDNGGRFWVPLAFAMLFPSTLLALMFGQTNMMVLFGLVGFLYWYRQEKDVLAGLSLSLLTIKPHLVYLTAPIILLYLLRDRRWRVMLSGALFLLLSLGLVFLLRPTFMAEYFSTSSDGNLFAYETATLSTWLSLQTGQLWLRLMGVGLLPLVMGGWFWLHRRLSMLVLIDLTLLLSVITMPFGWGYDFVVLLLPLTHLLFWLVRGETAVSPTERALILTLLIAIYLANFAQRIYTTNELYFFWIPPLFLLLYLWVYGRAASIKSNSSLPPASA